MDKWEREKSLEKENKHQKEIIRLFEVETGVYAADSAIMRQNFDLRVGIAKDCVPALKTCTDNLDIFKGRSKRRGWTIGIGLPVAVCVGFVGGVIYNSVK